MVATPEVDVNKHFEPKHIVNVMKSHPELFSDLPPIPADVAIGPGYVFNPYTALCRLILRPSPSSG